MKGTFAEHAWSRVIKNTKDIFTMGALAILFSYSSARASTLSDPSLFQAMQLMLSDGTDLQVDFMGPIDSPPHELEWISFHGLSKQELDQALVVHRPKGYRPTDIEAITVGSSTVYALIMRRSGGSRPWKLHVDLTAQGFSDLWTQYRSEGYRLVDQESYTARSASGSQVQRYAGIWVSNFESYDWVSNRNLTSDGFESKHVSYTDRRNLMPIDFDAYLLNGKLRYAGIWVQNTENFAWRLERDLTSTQFGNVFEEMRIQGYRLIKTNSYLFNGRQLFAGIWMKQANNPLASYAIRNMTEQSFEKRANEYHDLGYRMENIEVYLTSSGLRYSGIWVQNRKSDFSKTLTNTITREVQNWIKATHNDSFDSPMGLSVAIAHRGKIQYLKGYGISSLAKSEHAHSRTVFRTASVAKSISGTMAFLMQEEGSIDLSLPIKKALPKNEHLHHQYTIAETLTNRSMVQHTSDDFVSTSQYSAWEAAKLILPLPLVENAQNYHYSTSAFTIFTAAVEHLTGSKFCDQLIRLLSNPHYLPSLRCEDQSRGSFESERRSEIYRIKNKELQLRTRDNLSRKFAGGGMEVSPYDLLRFGMHFSSGRILSPEIVKTMTQRPNNQGTRYGYGWKHGTQSGVGKFYGHGGTQAGARSTLQIYPDHDLIIVIMANTWTKRHVTPLAEKLASIITEARP
jgi:CubicO group peptidase (beta-lactamase class C family)